MMQRPRLGSQNGDHGPSERQAHHHIQNIQSPQVIELPWVLTPRNGQTEVHVQGKPLLMPQEPHPEWVNAIRRAFQWRTELLEGRVATITALAQREGVTRRYAMRVLRLSFLAPDIIEAILQGQQPLHFTLEPFRRPIPGDWVAQRRYFGFPAVPFCGTAER